MERKQATLDIFEKTIYYAKDKEGNTYGIDMDFKEKLFKENVGGVTIACASVTVSG